MAEKIGAVLVVGGGIAGMQSSLDLANSGFKVYLVDSLPVIGGTMAQLDKTFPTNDCAMCIMAPKLVEVGRHPNIELITYSSLEEVTGDPGNFKVKIKKYKRFIDLEKCTGCAECEKVCPVELDSEFDEGLSNRHAIYRRYPQAIPNVYTIDKLGISPCRDACPAGVKCQGYVALISQGKFQEALDCVRENLPFPSVCGRVCHHPCEVACNRKDVDESIAIRPLKRFISDWASEHGEEQISPITPDKDEKIAIIGAGPGGLTCALRLMELGYPVTVFDSAPEAGGMITSCLPEYRIPKSAAKYDIDRILARGIKVKSNTRIGKDITLDEIRKDHKAVFVAIGSQDPATLPVKGADLNGVLYGLPFLRTAKEGNRPEGFGSKVVVIGGGNVAMDCAKTAKRLGAEKVSIVCLETRDLEHHDRMPAHDWEIEEAEEEEVEINGSLGPDEILGENGKVAGLRTIKCLSVYDEEHKFAPQFSCDMGPTLDADTIIIAIGQRSDLTGFEALDSDRGTFNVDKVTLQTSIPEIFAGGDITRGPASVIEAVADGNEAAISIDRFIRGVDLKEGREVESEVAKLPEREFECADRLDMSKREPGERAKNFEEIEINYDEETAVKEASRCVNCAICSECLQCVTVCKAEAIDHEMEEEVLDLQVGSIVLTPGFDEFDPKFKKEYGYEQYPNVVSSIEFERILSASGPFAGKVLRPSDQKPPKDVAFIQCVGSRDKACGNTYCSSVCCMYSMKEAIIAKEHDNNVNPHIFFMDIRAFGKEFDDYYNRAKNELDIKFIRSRPAAINQESDSKNLLLTYVDSGEIKTKEFDMVVLSVGLEHPRLAEELSEKLGVELNDYGFCKTGTFTPLETNKEGVFVAGAFSSPKDIPDTVAQASGAAVKASSIISSERGKLVTVEEYPPEKEVLGQAPRIGVFICHCGINIGGVVDVPAVVEYAKTQPNVVYSEHNLYTCSQDTQEGIKEKIKEFDLNRVIVASCTPRTHEPLFQNTIREGGLNPYLFEMANIRDQCSWVHMHMPAEATEKAKDLVRMAVANANLLEPLVKTRLEVKSAALVLGGGLAGMTAALELAHQGVDVHLVEKTDQLGGNLRKLHYTIETDGPEPQAILNNLTQQVQSHEKITVKTNTELKDIEGHVGNFNVILAPGGDVAQFETVNVGAIILATGGLEYKPKEFLYGQDQRIITQLELEESIANNKLPAGIENIVMIQCVGSRNEERPYCSRICCTTAVKNALKLKSINPKARIHVLFKDIRTYGFKEDYYSKALEEGVLFTRYDDDDLPSVSISEGNALDVTFRDPVLEQTMSLKPDLLVLSAAVLPEPSNNVVSKILKTQLSKDSFFLEAHMKLRPVDFATEGIFLCGMAHSPKFIDESISQACGAASRAMTILSRDYLEVGGVISTVDGDKCVACLTCVRVCPYEVPQINEKNVAEINEADCQGCGICASECPIKAIQLKHFKDDQVMAKCDALFIEEGV
jgi:heterodisulfide reductase subunit A-like polyferredoxin